MPSTVNYNGNISPGESYSVAQLYPFDSEAKYAKVDEFSYYLGLEDDLIDIIKGLDFSLDGLVMEDFFDNERSYRLFFS